jgi:hypothetical protein
MKENFSSQGFGLIDQGRFGVSAEYESSGTEKFEVEHVFLLGMPLMRYFMIEQFVVFVQTACPPADGQISASSRPTAENASKAFSISPFVSAAED